MSTTQKMISHNLDQQQSLIDSIRTTAGVPGLAIGVIHNHTITYERYHGHRDAQLMLPVDRDTMFYVASLTKAMTATAMGILVDKGLLQWTTPAHDILPEMSRETELYTAKLSVLDILSHRTGKAWGDALYLESNNRILLPKEQSIPIFDYLTQVEPVRSKYMYNNHAYNIAGLVIEKISGMNWDEFVTKNIFEPLGMTRTFTSHPDDTNVAMPYNILTNRDPWPLLPCNASNKTLMFAGQSVRTSIADLLEYSKAYLQALGEITPPSSASTATRYSGTKPLIKQQGLVPARVNPIRQIETIVRPHVARPVATVLEQTYGLGWNRTELPGSLDFGWNQQVVKPFPTLGDHYPGKLVIWHGGNMPGTTAAICLLPETGTAVVVLQNSLGLCDVADWVCQLLIDTIFLGKPAQNYLSLSKQSVDKGVDRMNQVKYQLEQERIIGTKSRPLNAYCGTYFNRIKNWFIRIEFDKEKESLYLEFLGRSDERYGLWHYHNDTFNWNLSYDELVKRGQYIRSYEYYKVEFESDESGVISRLRWRHDKSVPEGELFYMSNCP